MSLLMIMMLMCEMLKSQKHMSTIINRPLANLPLSTRISALGLWGGNYDWTKSEKILINYCLKISDGI